MSLYIHENNSNGYRLLHSFRRLKSESYPKKYLLTKTFYPAVYEAVKTSDSQLTPAASRGCYRKVIPLVFLGVYTLRWYDDKDRPHFIKKELRPVHLRWHAPNASCDYHYYEKSRGMYSKNMSAGAVAKQDWLTRWHLGPHSNDW